MIISNLNHLTTVAHDSDIQGGFFMAIADADAKAYARGIFFSKTDTYTKATAKSGLFSKTSYSKSSSSAVAI